MKELVIYCSESQVEEFSDIWLDLGALSVSVEDQDAGTEQERALFGEPGMPVDQQGWTNNQMIVLVPDEVSPDDFFLQFLAFSHLSPVPRYYVREVPNEDWVRLTQAQFQPILVNDAVWVIPSWHEVPPTQDLHPTPTIIRLDPGMAFGTGSHATTHLCLEWLSAHPLDDQRILDYGCGSGILGIAAKMRGARRVVGIDIDPQAVTTTQENAVANQVDIEVGLPADLTEETFDVVVANILSNPLRLLAPMLCARVQLGGYLVLSGILDSQAEELCAIYAPWISLSIWKSMDGWVCLSGQKTKEST